MLEKKYGLDCLRNYIHVEETSFKFHSVTSKAFRDTEHQGATSICTNHRAVWLPGVGKMGANSGFAMCCSGMTMGLVGTKPGV